ncbi:MFS transporter [Paenibacillus phytohabitans]|uniref:MFS transporter n=1 Tax=Paenibacillus phytohabitans TaxID=2654978 RepID=UPI00300BA2E8
MPRGIRKYSMHVYNYFFYIAYASYLPFLSYWFAENGLSAQQIGFIFSIGPLVGFLIQPVWGMLIDYYGIAKYVLIISMGVTPWVMLLYSFANHNFAAYVGISIVLAVFASATLPVVDAVTVRHAKKNALSYGSIRVVGSISFGLSVTLFGLLFDKYGLSVMFPAYIATMMLMCALSFMLDTEFTQKREDEEKPVKRGGMFREMLPLLRERRFLLFLIPVFIAAIGPQLNNAFYSVYISHFGEEASGKIGILYTISSIAEIPVFLFSGVIIRRLGYVRTLSLVSLAGALRWYILSLEPAFGILMMNQVLSGITYALFLATGINYAYDTSPAHTKTTAHSLFIIVYTNIAGITASNIGGYVIEAGGYRLLFGGAAVLSLIGAAGFALLGRSKAEKLRNFTT